MHSRSRNRDERIRQEHSDSRMPRGAGWFACGDSRIGRCLPAKHRNRSDNERHRPGRLVILWHDGQSAVCRRVVFPGTTGKKHAAGPIAGTTDGKEAARFVDVPAFRHWLLGCVRIRKNDRLASPANSTRSDNLHGRLRRQLLLSDCAKLKMPACRYHQIAK